METSKIKTYKKRINLILRTFGNTLIILSVFFLFLGFWPYLKAETIYEWDQLVGQKFYVQGDATTLPKGSSPLGSVITAPPPIAVTPINTTFSIIIPAINVNAYVTPNIDPNNVQQYEQALTKGAAQARGTVYPGQQGNSYIFAHSSTNFWDIAHYNSVFTLLRNVNVGDLIVTFYNGKRYDYYVTQKIIISPSSVSYLTPVAQGRQLTLQTCDPPGINLNRLLIIAKMR